MNNLVALEEGVITILDKETDELQRTAVTTTTQEEKWEKDLKKALYNRLFLSRKCSMVK